MPYENSKIEVNAGGYGFQAINGTTMLIADRIFGDPDSAAIAGGLLGTVRMRLYANNTNADATKARILVLRGTESPYTVVHDIDVLTEFQAAHAAGRFTLEVDLSSQELEIQSGDFIGGYFYCDGSTLIYGIQAAKDAADKRNNVLISLTGDHTIASPVALDYTIAADWLMDFTVWTSDYILLDSDNDAAGFAADDSIRLPVLSEPYYLMLEGVAVPDDGELDLNLTYSDSSTGEIATAVTATASYTGPTDGQLSIDGFTSNKDISGQETDLFNFCFWIDPENSRIDLIFSNRTTGQGPQGDSDFNYISTMDRSYYEFSGNLKFLDIADGIGGSSIARVAVCRKPVLAIGDSFTGSTTGALSHVASKLGESFSQERYVIPAGISGNRVLTAASSYHSALIDRWDSDNGDLIAFKNTVVVPINGPGLNDIASPCDSLLEQKTYTARLAAAIGEIAADALENNNDVVLCEMIPYLNETYSNQYNKECQRQLNACLQQLSKSMNVPIALIYGYPHGYDAALTHPDTAGDAWIASMIAMAYEVSIIASSATATGRLRGRYV